MPRSPSRDLSDRYIGRRGYFRNPDALRWWRYALAWLALFAAVAWAAVDVVKPSGAAYAHSHGPLTNPHAAFDNNCAACHAAHGLGDLGPSALFATRDRWHDLTCEKCHGGPAHHDSATAEAKAFHNRCSNCHHDHNGRLNSLVRLPDEHCTKCHTDLGQWHDASKSRAGTPYANKVTSFVTDHPAFRSLPSEAPPRAIKFSHALHMNAGQAYSPDGKEAMTVQKLRSLGGPAAVALYAPGAGDGAKIELKCESCHKLDSGRGTSEFDKLKGMLDSSGEPTRALLPPRPEGAYYLPVDFEASCRSCHPLTAPVGASADQVIDGFALPHRKQPAELLGDLKAGYLRGLIKAGHPALAARPEPGGKLDTPLATAGRTLAEETKRLADVAQHQLFSADGCAKCHKTAGSAESPSVVPVPDRTVWLTHAKFNHASHRGATCASCHPGTAARSDGKILPKEAEEPEKVQIEGLQSCRACHAPLGTQVDLGLPDGKKVSGGGVRHACTDCHAYHHGDLPLQGRGSDTWFPKNPRDIPAWLKAE